MNAMYIYMSPKLVMLNLISNFHLIPDFDQINFNPVVLTAHHSFFLRILFD